jgi:hypothetical protein
MPVKLRDVTSRIFQGIKTSADKIYIVEEIERNAKRVKIFSREKEAEYWLEPDLLHPLIKGGDSDDFGPLVVDRHKAKSIVLVFSAVTSNLSIINLPDHI